MIKLTTDSELSTKDIEKIEVTLSDILETQLHTSISFDGKHQVILIFRGN